MKIIFRLKTILVMSVAISTVLLVATVFFIVPNTNAQTDIDACQNEYNASRSKCIEDNKICNASCGENYDCKLACNLEANSCEDATVDRQRKCLGVWPYDQSSDQDLPVVDVSPTTGKPASNNNSSASSATNFSKDTSYDYAAAHNHKTAGTAGRTINRTSSPNKIG